MKLLMVCLGNICRSPLAEGILQHKVKQYHLNWMVDSAGTNGFHTGESPHPLSQKVARLNGIDIGRQVSRRLTQSDFSEFDLLIAMADDVVHDMRRIAGPAFPSHKVKLMTEWLYPDAPIDVPDPWYGPEKGYHEVFQLLNESCEALILSCLNGNLPTETH